MNILQLPPTIILEIFAMLDIKSKLQLYYTSEHIRALLRISNTLRINLSCTTLGTAHTLRRVFFTDLAHSIRYLNLAGVLDLKPRHGYIVKNMHLRELNMGFTYLQMRDALDFIPSTLRRLHISIDNEDSQFICHEIHKIRESFKNLHYINFVVYFPLDANSFTTLFKHLIHLQEMEITHAKRIVLNALDPRSAPDHFQIISTGNLRKFSISCNGGVEGRIVDLQPLPRLINAEFLIFVTNAKVKVMSSPNVAYLIKHIIDINDSFIQVEKNIDNVLFTKVHSSLKLYLWNGYCSYDIIADDIKKIVPNFCCRKRSLINRFHKDIFIGSCLQTLFDNVSRLVDRWHREVILSHICTICHMEQLRFKVIFTSVNIKNLTSLVLISVTIHEYLFKVVLKACQLQSLHMENLTCCHKIRPYLLFCNAAHLYPTPKLKNVYLSHYYQMNIEMVFKALSKCSAIETVTVHSEVSVVFSKRGLINNIKKLIAQCPKLFSLHLTHNLNKALNNEYFKVFSATIGRDVIHFAVENEVEDLDAVFLLKLRY